MSASELVVHQSGSLDRPASAAEIRTQVNLIQEVMQAVMQPGHHFGRVPGCDKPSLWKPGAEKLFLTFRIAVRQHVEDLSTNDAARFRVRAEAFHMGTGTALGDATGECSSDEEKYRWRRAVCDEEWEATPENQRRVKWGKKDGKVYQVKQVKTHPADVANTVLKMAAKRAEVALALRVTAASDIFTQDIEDLPDELREVVGDDRPPVQQPQRKVKSEPEQHEGELLGGVLISSVAVKDGEKDGKAWRKYSVKVGDSWYTTFSETDGELAVQMKDAKTPVNLYWVRKGDYLNLTGIEPCQS